jgi:hypothetical protein
MLLATMRPIKARKINTGEAATTKLDEELDSSPKSNGERVSGQAADGATIERPRPTATFEEYNPDWAKLPAASEVVRTQLHVFFPQFK